MFKILYGNSADEVWKKAVNELIELQATSKIQPSRAGNTYELLHAAISISNPRQRWVISRVPPINPAFAIAEIIWIMNGRNDSAFLNYFNNQVHKYAGDGKYYHGAYGYRLRKNLEIDQLKQAYETLRSNPESRQVVLQIWDSSIDLPKHDGKPIDPDVPCNLISMLKIRDGKLEWTQIIRSNDIFLGLPHNFVQFTTLQEIIAGWLKLEMGSYNQISDSLHVYESKITNLKLTKSNDPPPENTDLIQMSFDESEATFSELATRTDKLISENLSEAELRKIVSWPNNTTWAQNMLCVLCAETARRRSWPITLKCCMDKCNNPVLLKLWDQWLIRVSANLPY